jgi:hypothetical protein
MTVEVRWGGICRWALAGDTRRRSNGCIGGGAMDYPSEGARHSAETGKTVAQSVIEDAGIPDGDLA